MGWLSAPTADTRAATIIVAASDSKYPAKADYQCDGVNDHIEIQAALDALPATGGEVKLLDGTYNCEVGCGRNISNLTFRGCGRNTILTTATPNLVFLSFVGTSGAELTGIVITDLQIDGGAGSISDCGIYFEYVDYSFIQNVYSRRHAPGTGSYLVGIYLTYSDFNQIVNNTYQGNGYNGIYLDSSSNNTVSGNTCQGNNNGIYLWGSSDNNISGNTCQGNNIGIYLVSSFNNTISGSTCQGNSGSGICLDSSSNNTVSGNTCQGNSGSGIYLVNSFNNNISGNTCLENSQNEDIVFDNILLGSSGYNLIIGNVCRRGALTNKPQYGINISDDDSDRNCLIGNDLYDSGTTGDLNDVPTTNPTLKHDNRNLAGTGWLTEV